MKHARKLVSLLLALVLLLAMTTTAFADTTGTITVDNPKTGETYTAYKIFDVKYNGDAYSYTIDSTSEWFSVVKDFADDAAKGLTITKIGETNTYVVKHTDAFSAADFAAHLKANKNGKTGTELASQDDGTVSINNLPLGYYFVASTNGALCNLTTTNDSVTIHDKNYIPFDKVDDQQSVDVGQVVHYTITSAIPDYTGFDTYTYEITDEMSAGLTFNKDVVVSLEGTNITSDCTIEYDVDGKANKFTVTVPVKSYTIGDELVLTYSAVVNENAVAKIEKNHAVLKYSNDPTDGTKYGTFTVEETVYSAKIVIDKYVKDNTNQKLAGATFVLYKEETNGVDEDAVTTKLYYKWNDTDKKVEWVADKEQATSKITDDNGAASFDGIADGIYKLEETAAPVGYNLLTEAVEITISGASATEANLSALTVTEPIANETGSLLPSTGGMGTTLFYVLGSVLAVGAIALLITRRRMSAR